MDFHSNGRIGGPDAVSVAKGLAKRLQAEKEKIFQPPPAKQHKCAATSMLHSPSATIMS
jgi:hypothetical protein